MITMTPHLLYNAPVGREVLLVHHHRIGHLVEDLQHVLM
jgi:hypothetical protein